MDRPEPRCVGQASHPSRQTILATTPEDVAKVIAEARARSAAMGLYLWLVVVTSVRACRRQMRSSRQHEVLFSLTAHGQGLTRSCDRADLECRHARPKRHFYFFRVRHLGVTKESGVSRGGPGNPAPSMYCLRFLRPVAAVFGASRDDTISQRGRRIHGEADHLV